MWLTRRLAPRRRRSSPLSASSSPPRRRTSRSSQLRVITKNATGNDEWVGIDDITVTSSVVPPGDDAPAVASSSPSAGASGVAISADVGIAFTEPVATSATAFSIACEMSGSHSFALSGGPTAYTLDPDSDFVNGESCTVTVVGPAVSDVDADDPPERGDQPLFDADRDPAAPPSATRTSSRATRRRSTTSSSARSSRSTSLGTTSFTSTRSSRNR